MLKEYFIIKKFIESFSKQNFWFFLVQVKINTIVERTLDGMNMRLEGGCLKKNLWETCLIHLRRSVIF